MFSYPTPPNAARTEKMSSGFLKLHPGSPIHYFTEARDEEYHTHPFSFISHVVVGGYREEILSVGADGKWEVLTFDRLPGTSHQIDVGIPHRLVGLLNGPCITRCEYGPSTHKPGFIRLDEAGIAWRRDWDSNEWSLLPPPTAID